MGQRIFTEEAERCRQWAEELAGLPDAVVLRRIAQAFDGLARERGPAAGWMPRPTSHSARESRSQA